jgi:hypothetical protein
MLLAEDVPFMVRSPGRTLLLSVGQDIFIVIGGSKRCAFTVDEENRDATKNTRHDIVKRYMVDINRYRSDLLHMSNSSKD